MPDSTAPTTSLSDLLHAVTALLEGPLAGVRGADDLHYAIGAARQIMPYNDLVRRMPVPLDLLDKTGDRTAREVAMASVIWLASDGNDDAYDDWKSKVERWQEAVLDG